MNLCDGGYKGIYMILKRTKQHYLSLVGSFVQQMPKCLPGAGTSTRAVRDKCYNEESYETENIGTLWGCG